MHDGFLANRVSAGMIAIMLVLLEDGDRALSLVPADRSHPSIRQAVLLARGTFEEAIGAEAFAEAVAREPAPRVVVITTISPSKNHLPLQDLVRAIALARQRGARVVLDDAHMAARVAIYGEPPGLALDPAPDVTVWSLDKHVRGPRSGFVAGNTGLICRIKARALALGVEAQLGQYIAGFHAVESFDPVPIQAAAAMSRRGSGTPLFLSFCAAPREKAVGRLGEQDHEREARHMRRRDEGHARAQRLGLDRHLRDAAGRTGEQSVSNRIINEVRGINRAVYDVSGKPPATVEWE